MSFRTLVLTLFAFTIFTALGNTAAAQDMFDPWSEKHERFSEANADRLSPQNQAAPFIENQQQERDKNQSARKNRIPTSPLSKAQKFSQGRLSAKPSPSALEEMYSGRIVDELTQFGYDLFGVPSMETQQQLGKVAATTKPMGAVQEDFILGGGAAHIHNGADHADGFMGHMGDKLWVLN